MTDTTHEPDIEPLWQVLSIFDDEGGGAEFAYTTGLAGVGLPELHIWARPTDGDDPGLDWMLSMRDRCQVLNELARLLIDGRLGEGSQLVRRYDGGATTVTFRVGALVAPDEVEAYQVADGATVLPVRWSLQRAPEGKPTGLTPAAALWVGEEFARLSSGLDRSVALPTGWALPTQPLDVSSSQRFGPLTPLVLARAGAVITASVGDLANFLHRMADAERATGLRHTWALAMAAARPVGRSSVVAACQKAAEEIARLVVGPDFTARRWHQVLAACDCPLDAEERRHLHQGTSGLLLDGVATLLATQALADVAPRSTVLAGLGPWSAATSATGVTPGPGWHVSPPVLATVRRMLGPLDLESLCSLVAYGMLAGHGDPRATSRGDAYAALASRLLGLAITSASASPTPAELLAGTPAAETLARAPQMAANLASWISCLTALLSFRASFSAEEVATFAEPARFALPELAETLNAPVVAV